MGVFTEKTIKATIKVSELSDFDKLDILDLFGRLEVAEQKELIKIILARFYYVYENKEVIKLIFDYANYESALSCLEELKQEILKERKGVKNGYKK